MFRMRRQTLRSWVYTVISVLHTSSVGVSLIVAAALKADPTAFPDGYKFLLDPIQWLQRSAWWAIGVATVTIIGTRMFRAWAGPPRTWRVIQSLLDKIQSQAFLDPDGEPLHHNRVTLFEHRRFHMRCGKWGKGRWPWSGWLVPVLRSGHTNQYSETVFLAPDDADRAEGIAGQVWSRFKILILEKGLPDLDSDPPTPGAIDTYARMTWVSRDWVQRRLESKKPCARSLAGIPLEASGKRWGVLVLDSRRAEAIRDLDPNGPAYGLMGFFLGKLLEEA